MSFIDQHFDSDAYETQESWQLSNLENELERAHEELDAKDEFIETLMELVMDLTEVSNQLIIKLAAPEVQGEEKS